MKSALIAITISLIAFVGGFALGAGYMVSRTWDLMETNDRQVALTSIIALRLLESGSLEIAKKNLAAPISSYYVIHGPPNHPNKKISDDQLTFLRNIEKLAENSTALQHALKKSAEAVAPNSTR